MRKLLICVGLVLFCNLLRADELERSFQAPPEAARPWVYWYFMDGNLSREGMTADLESMKQVGIGGGIFLEVDVGIPRGTVKFMSEPWQELVKHGICEADRLGLQIALGAGPGWCGTGGPWVKPEQSMQHLVSSETNVSGPARFDAALPRPQPRTPFFGEQTLTPELRQIWKDFYRDVAVIAFPTPAGKARLADSDEKALFFRAPYSSQPGVKPFLPSPSDAAAVSAEQTVSSNKVVDLTGKLSADGRLIWDVPAGNWTIMRFGRTVTAQTTRPAPFPGLGFESDKFDKAALDAHFDAFVGKLLQTIGPRKNSGSGLTTLHFDSWEMSSQNWSEEFRQEFQKRRGYDPLHFLPAMTGRVVESAEISERFLWDLRLTAQELVIENHAMRLKELAHRNGMQLSIEPYDLNPAGDLALGSVADVPMCEFWSKGYGFDSEFSCFEAVSLGHTMGRPVVAAESFTANPGEDWRLYPGALKLQADWALCAGINRLVFHRYQHQPWLDRWPGMTMGPYGVHWERTQTWWDMVPAFHTYLTRCQMMLRRGLPVADILYLDREGAPNVFRPPASATQAGLPDRRGYNFDGCAPGTLLARANVKKGRIVFPDGMSYRVLVLPRCDTITPALLRKINELVKAGATVVGAPPKKSPSLVDYPQCDSEIKLLASKIWGDTPIPERRVGRGTIVLDNDDRNSQAGVTFPDVYPNYASTAALLAKLGVVPDFESDCDLRYIHRRDGDTDIYFVGNRTSEALTATCRFRVAGRQPELWDAVTGERRSLAQFEEGRGVTSVPLHFAPAQSFFVIFRQHGEPALNVQNFSQTKPVTELSGSWQVAFDKKWGGPEQVEFEKLEDWTRRPEPGIRFYSGKASYRKTFDLSKSESGTLKRQYLTLGKVSVMASVRLNGHDLGIVWCDPWRVSIPPGLLRERGNEVEITVANLWCNRLIGDSALPQEKRLTWTTRDAFKPTDSLLPSGLLGPVTVEVEQ